MLFSVPHPNASGQEDEEYKYLIIYNYNIHSVTDINDACNQLGNLCNYFYICELIITVSFIFKIKILFWLEQKYYYIIQ